MRGRKGCYPVTAKHTIFIYAARNGQFDLFNGPLTQQYILLLEKCICVCVCVCVCVCNTKIKSRLPLRVHSLIDIFAKGTYLLLRTARPSRLWCRIAS